MACIMLRFVPSIPTLVKLFIWIDVEFCQMFFLHLVRLSGIFFSFLLLMWCITFIYVCGFILVTLEWIQLDHGWYLCIVEFIFLIFSDVCIYINQRYWSIIFFAMFVLESGWWWPHTMNLGVFSLLQFSGIVWEDRY